MKLFTKALETKLQKAYGKYSTDEDPMIIMKIFNPYGNQTWYIMNQDPEDHDYLWGYGDLGYGIDATPGSMSKSEFESIRVNVFGQRLPLERDMYFDPIPASELRRKLENGEHV